MTFLAENILWLFAGLGLGAAYMFLIWRTVLVIQAPNAKLSALLPVALRLGLAAGVLYVASQHGVVPVIMTLVGFQLVRSLAIHRVRRM